MSRFIKIELDSDPDLDLDWDLDSEKVWAKFHAESMAKLESGPDSE